MHDDLATIPGAADVELAHLGTVGSGTAHVRDGVLVGTLPVATVADRDDVGTGRNGVGWRDRNDRKGRQKSSPERNSESCHHGGPRFLLGSRPHAVRAVHNAKIP